MLNKDKKTVYSYIHIIVVLRYQDIHTQSCIMVFASQRWLGVRLDCLSALLTCAVALAAVFVSQDAVLVNSLVHVMRNGTGYSMFICEIHFSRFLPPYAICDALE